MKYTKKSSKVRKTSSKRKYIRKPKVSTTIKRYVKKVIHSNIENKTEQTLSANNVISSYANNNNLFVVSMIPYGNIAQGVGQGDRIGNLITTVSCYLNFTIRTANYSATYNPVPVPQTVYVFLGKVKNSPPFTPTNTDFAKLWQAGDSFHAPYGNNLDNLQNVNKDWFTVYKFMKFKIGYAAVTAAGFNSAYEYYSNNDFKFSVTKRMNITRFMPKKVKFNDSTTQPTNDNLWMWAFCNPIDGSAATTIPCYMDYTVNYVYEDA